MNEKEELLNKINELYEEAKYQQILDLLTEDVLAKANDSELFCWQARIFNQLKNYEEALKSAKKAIIADSNNPHAYFHQANIYGELKKYPQALENYNIAISLDSEYTDAYFNRGVIFQTIENYSEALSNYDKAIQIDNNYSNAYANRGIINFNLDKFDESLSDYNRAIEINNEFLDAYFNRAQLLVKIQKYEAAINDYNYVIEKEPKNDDAYNGRAIAYFHLNLFRQALNDYNKAIQLNPEDYYAYTNRGGIFALEGKYQEAIQNFDKAISIKNDYFDAYFNRASAFLRLKEYDKAIEDFNKAIDITPTELFAFQQRANAFYYIAKYDEAFADLNQVLENDTKNAFALHNRGILNLKFGNYEHALDDFKRAKNIDGKNFFFLEDEITRIEEKIQLEKALSESGVSENFIDKKIKIELEIKRIISEIKSISKFEGEYVVHYTKMTLAEIFVKNNKAKMNYSNVVYMNDPLEGKLFFDYLNDENIKKSFEIAKSRSETSVYLGSFLPVDDSGNERSHEDDLVMWRTYGKDENGREASGCSIVIDTNFFQTVAEPKKATQSDNKISPPIQLSSFPEDERLMTMIYLKKNKDGLFEIEGQFKNKIKDEIEKLKEQLKLLIELIELIELIDGTTLLSKIFKDSMEDIIFQELSELSYLFKSSDYSFENEVRIIKHMSLDSDLVLCREINSSNTPNKILYIESNNNILPYIRKIYIGPKVEQKEKWSLYLDYEIRQRNKEMKKHESNISENIATSEEAKQDKLDIKIIKSKCKFQ